MEKYNRPEQKLISFFEGSGEINQVANDMNDGWVITSLVKNGNYFVGIMEKAKKRPEGSSVVFIPPRKKIKIMSN